MLTQKQIKEIKDHLEAAQNPIFFFDNDQDGLCSFLLLQRYLSKGKGVVIKSFPELDESYFRKVDELNSDYIFILDKPLVSKDFLERAKERNIPVVWIDHHSVDISPPDFVFYFNPGLSGDFCEPVTFLCYQVTKKKQDLWIAVIGAISDGFLPDYYLDFLSDFPELGVKTKDAFEVLYNSKIGEIAVILSNGLKDTTTNVVRMLKYLISSNSPYDILEENSKNFFLHQRSKFIKEKYDKILLKAKTAARGPKKIVFFKYSGDLSVSSEISNHLKYLFPGKIVVVAYCSGSKLNLSLRGKNVKKFFLNVISGFSNATGGGHNEAVGGQLQVNDWEEFKKRFEEEVGN